MTHKGSTRAVIRNLSREDGIWDSPGDRFSNQNLERFIADASSWLRDKSELKGSTIDTADWREVYAAFRAECEGHESLDGAHMGEIVFCDGSCT
jgi:hypothetical protein